MKSILLNSNTYILPNLIAMGFPARNVQKVYRNDFDDFLRFLKEEIEPKGDFQIYNLCPESERDIYGNAAIREKVNNNFTTEDHNPPRFVDMIAFCSCASVELHKEDTTLIIHCKAGKGRTGVMVCILLLDCGRFTCAKDALLFYADSRTYDGKGVTIPSQRRYVHYYELYLRGRRVYDDKRILHLRGLLIRMKLNDDHLKKIDLGDKRTDLGVVIQKKVNSETLAHGKLRLMNANKSVDEIALIYLCTKWWPYSASSDKEPDKIKNHVDLINDNVFLIKKSSFKNEPSFKTPVTSKEKICQFWLNTYFISLRKITDPEILSLLEVDPDLKSQVSNLAICDLLKEDLDKIHKLNKPCLPDVKY
ncbi:hypothetical protein ACOME3_009677 [Neoechinorhynchus agilis]